ncbi:MAG: amidohydrolase family protein [Flavobacteriaceae bacterium]|nr:amidohydrolase family protein [Flavobacteriaceae bacterium]
MKHFIYIFLLSCSIMLAQQTPAPNQTQGISIEGATAHLGNGEVIENSLVMFENGKITFVGSAYAKIARTGTVINASGKHIYPGFIATNSTLGLIEIGAVRATNDQAEIGNFKPHIRSLIAYNAESKIVESVRPNGVLTAQITPRGGRIAGSSSIVQLDAWNWEDASIKTDDAIHINWPRTFTRTGWWTGNPETKPNKDYQKQIDEMNTFFNEARNYLKGNPSEKNIVFESMKEVLAKNKKVFINANDEKQIIDAVTFAQNQGLDIAIVGGYEAPKTIDLLKKHTIPVLVQRIHSSPDNEDDDYDYPYKLAQLLNEKGILVGLEGSGSMEQMNTRNLPFYAGTCVAHGMSKEDALKLITSNTAKILGMDTTLGSLEVGKDATLFISNGDALEMMGNSLTKAYIQGRDISLETHQTKLWKRYSDKYKN